MSVGVGVWIRATIRQVGKQVPLVIVLADIALFLLQCVYLKTISQECAKNIKIEIIRRTWWSLKPMRRLTTFVRAPPLNMRT